MTLRAQFLMLAVLLMAGATCAVTGWLVGDGPVRTVLMFGLFFFGILFLSLGFLAVSQAISPIEEGPRPSQPEGRDSTGTPVGAPPRKRAA
jgi:hypothetical protein